MKILITAGPTREAIDPVRYLSNRSSGKMGFALAEAASLLGHEVALVSGPVSLTPPSGIAFYKVQTAQELWENVHVLTAQFQPDIAIHAAAVADYRPRFSEAQKIKKNAETLTLELERTPDVLGSMRSFFGFKGLLIGFAAETENLIPNAQSKLTRKGCDLVVANDVSRDDSGFDSENNEVILCYPDQRTEAIPKMSKRELAHLIIQKSLDLAS